MERGRFNVANAVALLLLLAGAALTAWGLAKIGIPGQGRNLQVWLVLAVVLSALVFAARMRPVVTVALVAAVVTLASGQVLPVLVVAWFVASATLVGGWTLRVLRIDPQPLSPLVLFLAGSGVLGTIVGLMAHFPVNFPGVYAVGLALPLVAGRSELLRWVFAAVDFRKGGGVPLALPERWLEIAIGVAALIHFVVAFLPEIAYDALAMHLFVAEALRTRHQWGFDVQTYVWALFPLLVDWTYAIVNMLGGETAARLLNVAFVFSVAWLVRDLVRWAGGSRAGERWAVLLFLVTPLTFTESNSLFIEGGWTAFLVAGMFAMLKVLDGSSESKQGIPLAGLLCGFALASKAVTFAVLPALLVVMLARPSAWLRPAHAGALAKGLAIGALVGCVPYVTAWWIAANPVFPFFNATFKSPFYAAVNFEPPPFERYLTWDTIYRVTFDSPRYLEGERGTAGFQWLLLLVPCAAALLLRPEWRRRSLVLLVLGGVGVAGVFQQTAYLRYVFPSLAFLLALVGVGIGVLATGGARFLWHGVAAAVVLLNVLFFNMGTGYRDFPLDAIVSPAVREDLLASRRPIRTVVPLVNELNGPAAPVFWIADSQATGLVADALYPQWYNFSFLHALSAVPNDTAMAAFMNRRGAEFAVIDSDWQYARNIALAIERVVAVTDEVASVGSVSVRRLKRAYMYTRELVKSPDFADGAAWSLVPGATYDAAQKAVVVTPQAGAFQRVPVTAGRKYLNTHSARCQPGTEGRLQVNWLDKSGRMLPTSSKAYRCTADWSRFTMEVTAPTGAAVALVYTWGQAGGPVTVNLNSFRSSS